VKSLGSAKRLRARAGGRRRILGRVRYGESGLYTKNAGDLRVFWQGPSLGLDFGGEGARTIMLIYGLPATGAIYQRFVGIDGSAYFVGGGRLLDRKVGGLHAAHNPVYVVGGAAEQVGQLRAIPACADRPPP
jgi:hypothetical protein